MKKLLKLLKCDISGIPLYKELLGGIVIILGLITFCSAEKVFNNITAESNSVGGHSSNSFNISLNSGGAFCAKKQSASLSCSSTVSSNTYQFDSTTTSLNCVYNDSSSVLNFSVDCTNSMSSNGTIYFYYFNPGYNQCQQCQECEECQECPTIDSQYCVSNNLCPSCEGTGSSCEEGDGNWSALYINNIQHQSAPIINVDIPDYIYWDYSSSEEEFDLYVGSGYDQDYIDNVIAINSYQPTSEDFTDVFVSGLTLVMPYIVIVLFIVFIRKLIKRIFK